MSEGNKGTLMRQYVLLRFPAESGSNDAEFSEPIAVSDSSDKLLDWLRANSDLGDGGVMRGARKPSLVWYTLAEQGHVDYEFGCVEVPMVVVGSTGGLPVAGRYVMAKAFGAHLIEVVETTAGQRFWRHEGTPELFSVPPDCKSLVPIITRPSRGE